jgi:hypothetical protein
LPPCSQTNSSTGEGYCLRRCQRSLEHLKSLLGQPGKSPRTHDRSLHRAETRSTRHEPRATRLTAQLLYQNPDLINDRQFVRRHDALHDWLEDHQEAAATIQANPDKFLWRERSVGATDFLRQLLK